MKSRRCAVVLIVAALLGACGGSDGDEVVDSVDAAPTTTVDLTDGAFVRNESVILDADGEPVATQTTVVPDDETSTTVADPTSSEKPESAGTSSDGASTDEGSESAGRATDSDASGSGESSAAPEAGSQEGLIDIDGVVYAFETELCEITTDAVEIAGRGTTTDGARFEANIVYDRVDIDGDGAPDSVLEVYVDPEVPAGSEADTVSEFYALSAESSDSPGSLVFEIAGLRISGSGTIEDINGVAFPSDRPAPMAFDANCG